MKTITEHIAYVKEKPHHIRKRVVLGAASGISALIAVVWLGFNLSTGAFAIQGANFAMSTGQSVVATTSDTGAPSGLAGAAAAVEDANAPAHIEIVDTTPAQPAKKQSDQTILPF